MKKNKVLYYKDESKDDFQNTKTFLHVTVDENYNYLPKNIFFRIFSFWFYYLVAFPLLQIANLLIFGTRVKGRKNLKNLKRQGYFIYANHTNYKDSWLAPISIAPFRKVYIISSKDAVQIPVINVLTKSAGALPIPDTISGLKNLNLAVDKLIKNKKIITIFPEAHIWPYYTKIRPFPITSFKFATVTNSPAVPVAVCYKKRKLFGNKRKPRAVVFIGKPVFPKAELTDKENAIYLRDEVFKYIKKKLQKESTYEYIKYIKLQELPFEEKFNEELKEEIVWFLLFYALKTSCICEVMNDLSFSDQTISVRFGLFVT